MTRKGTIKGSRRIKILAKNYGICVYCNEVPAEHIEHILPRSWKIDNSDDNLVGACSDCNHIASDMIFESFEQKQAYILSELKKPRWRRRRESRPYIYILHANNEPDTRKEKPSEPRPQQTPRVVKAKLELTEFEKKTTIVSLKELLEVFDSHTGKVAAYTELAWRLSEVVHRSPPWSWRYVQSIEKGTVGISEKFWRAVSLLSGQVDGLPSTIANTELVKIYALPGTVRENSLIMAASRKCATPSCTVVFVPNVPWRTHCPVCRPTIAMPVDQKVEK